MKLADTLEAALNQPAAAGTGGPTAACRVAVVVKRSAQTEADRLNRLMYIAAVNALITLALGVVMLSLVNAAQGAGTVIAGLLTLGVTKIIRDDRNRRLADRDTAQRILNQQCGNHTEQQILAAMDVHPEPKPRTRALKRRPTRPLPHPSSRSHHR